MLHTTLGREFGNISCQECEGVVWVALVLSEVQRHAADQPPLRAALAQVGLYAARVVFDFVADERVELQPPRRQHFAAQVLTPQIGGACKT